VDHGGSTGLRRRIVEGDDEGRHSSQGQCGEGAGSDPMGVDHIGSGPDLAQTAQGRKVAHRVRTVAELERDNVRSRVCIAELLGHRHRRRHHHLVPCGDESLHEIVDVSPDTAGARAQDEQHLHERPLR